MSEALSRSITGAEIGTYDRDGVVFLEGVFGNDWITLLQAGAGGKPRGALFAGTDLLPG